MFQKLEKDLIRDHPKKENRFFLIKFIFLFSSIFAQIDQRFDLFDWHISSKNGSINSISEGYEYIYFATQFNGILRFNKFSRKFDSNLFLGQGIKSKIIKHVYFDKNTGILWIVGNKGLEYSTNKEGNWRNINLQRLSISSSNKIEDIGSSKSFIWIKTKSSYIKIDNLSGTFLGIFSIPDENLIDWGDLNLASFQQFGNFSFENYFMVGGWLLGKDSVADNNGIFHKFTSYLETVNGYSWMGLSNGQLLFIDNFSKDITPKTLDIGVSIPLTISFEDKLWIGGISETYSVITSISRNFEDVRNFYEFNYSNFNGANFYSSEIIDNEIWFGSDKKLIIYNKKNDFFRTLGYEKGIPNNNIKFIKNFNDNVFVASSNDLIILNAKTKKIIRSSVSEIIEKSVVEINDLNVINDKLYLVVDGKIFIVDNNERINFEKYEFISQKDFRIKKIFGDQNYLFFSSSRGILNNINDKIIPSSVYFNYEVNGMKLIDDILYIGTSGGLAIYDIKNNQLNNFYDFSFIRNIFKVELVDNFLVLLTNVGLIKLNLS